MLHATVHVYTRCVVRKYGPVVDVAVTGLKKTITIRSPLQVGIFSIMVAHEWKVHLLILLSVVL